MKLTQLNMVSWVFYVHLVANSFIASFLVINGWDSTGLKDMIGKEAKLYGWIAIQYTMIAMPLAMLFVNYLYGYKSSSGLFLSYTGAPMRPLVSKEDSFLKYSLYLLSLLSILSVVYVFATIKTIPLLNALQGWDAKSLAVLRVEVGREFAGSTTIKNFFSLTIMPIIAYVAYAYWRMSNKWSDLLWFLITSFFAAIILTYDLQKTPFIMFLLGFMFANILIEGAVKKKTLIIFVSAGLILIIASYVIIVKSDNYEFIIRVIMMRVFEGQAAGTFFAFEYFPNSIDFIGLSSFLPYYRNLLGMNTSENAARTLITTIHPEGLQENTAGVMNSLFMQEAWANYGIIGVVIAPLYVGIFIQIIYILFLKSRKAPVMVGLLAYFTYRMPVTNDFNSFIVPFNMIQVFLVFALAYVFALLLKKSKQPKGNVKLSNT